MVRWIERARMIYERADRLSGGVISTIYQSVTRFAQLRGPEAAATLAYFALFSLFPLTLTLVAVLGYLFGSEGAYAQTLAFIRGALPFAGDLVERNLNEVLEKRGTIGVIGLLGALWSASGFFTTLDRSINRAWPTVKLRGIVHSRLVALGMIGSLFLFLLISLVSSTILHFLPTVLERNGISFTLLGTPAWKVVLRMFPFGFSFVLFTGLYRMVPNKTVPWRAALPGAAATTLLWELAKQIFTFYLRSGFARYEILYGSLGTLIVLMVWIYVGNVIILYGAHLVATIDLRLELVVGTRAAERSEHKTEPGAVKSVRG